MPPDIQSLTHAPLHWNVGLPAVFRGPRLPGSIARHAKGAFGFLSLQEVLTEQYMIRYMTVTPQENFAIQLQIPTGVLHAHLSLEGSSAVHVNGDEGKPFHKHQFILFDDVQSGFASSYPPGNECHYLDTSLSGETSSELRTLLAGSGITGLDGTTVKPVWAGSEVLGIVRGILACDYAYGLLLYHYRNRVRDLFLQYVLRWQQQPVRFADLQPRILEAVSAAEKLISSDLRKHYSIRELCRKTGMNEFDLKTYFPVVFGLAPYEYLVHKRMEYARLLLEQGASVKEAAGSVAMRPANFSIAFFRHFGFYASTLLKTD